MLQFCVYLHEACVARSTGKGVGTNIRTYTHIYGIYKFSI